MIAFGLICSLAAQGLSVPGDVSVVGFDGLRLGARFNPPLTTVRQPIAEMGRIAIDLAEKAANGGPVEHVVLEPRAAGALLDRARHPVTGAAAARAPARRPCRVHRARPRRGRPLLRRGRSGRRSCTAPPADPMPSFMPENFDVPPDARLELAMLRMPPNLNVELFEWSSSDRRTEHPRHSDGGGHHLCFVVDDVDQAVAPPRHASRACECSATARKSVRRQPPRRRQPMDLLPHAVGTADGARRPFPSGRPAAPGRPRRLATAADDTQGAPCLMLIAGHTLGTPDRPSRGARAVRRRRPRRRRGDLPGRLPLRARRCGPALRASRPGGRPTTWVSRSSG